MECFGNITYGSTAKRDAPTSDFVLVGRFRDDGSDRSLWRANAATCASASESSRTDSTIPLAVSRTGDRRVRPDQHGPNSRSDSRGWLLVEFGCREEFRLRRAGTSGDAWRTSREWIAGEPGSFKPVQYPADDSAVVVRSGREYSLLATCALGSSKPSAGTRPPCHSAARIHVALEMCHTVRPENTFRVSTHRGPAGRTI